MTMTNFLITIITILNFESGWNLEFKIWGYLTTIDRETFPLHLGEWK